MMRAITVIAFACLRRSTCLRFRPRRPFLAPCSGIYPRKRPARNSTTTIA